MVAHSTGAPRVSIVVTCYNYGAYVARCLASIQAQTFTDFEAIVVDDGSTDDSAEVIAPFLADSRIRYVRQANAGQANAKNRGIGLARGELIAFLDADDSYMSDKLSLQVPLFDEVGVGVVYSLAEYVNERDEILPYHPLSGRFSLPREGRVCDYLFVDNFVPFSSAMVRRQCIEKFGAFDETVAMGIDWDLWLRISTAYEFRCVHQPLIRYRMGHANQMSKKLEVRQKCTDRIMETFLRTYPGAVSPAFERTARWYTAMNRGYYYRTVDLRRSTNHFVQALRARPLSLSAHKSLVRNALLGLVRRQTPSDHADSAA